MRFSQRKKRILIGGVIGFFCPFLLFLTLILTGQFVVDSEIDRVLTPIFATVRGLFPPTHCGQNLACDILLGMSEIGLFFMIVGGIIAWIVDLLVTQNKRKNI